MKNQIYFFKKTAKLIALLLLCMGYTQAIAQDKFFVHTATTANSSGAASYIDHPYLNGNPDAKLIASHIYNPPGQGSVYNNKISGVFYSTTQNKWTVFNEDDTSVITGSSYFVYIAENSNSFVHTATATGLYSQMNNSLTNGNPDQIIAFINRYPGWNNKNTGIWYNPGDSRWTFYNQDGSNISANDSYMVATPGGGASAGYKHQATSGNISGNYTEIDHPLLNGNPNGKFVFSHNWGVDGEVGNVILNKVLGAWYTGTRWAIYTEDLSAMPVNATFNLLIGDDYCTPYMRSGFEHITNVTFAGINNNSGAQTGISYYLDQQATVSQGETYSISVTISPDENEYIYVFFDWNQDGDFDDAGEVFTVASNTSSTGPHTIDITVPAGATLGETRMRVLLAYSNSTPNPCMTNDGEAEDYTVVVEPAMSIEENELTKVMLYPNPAKDFVTLANLPDGSVVKVVDITGKVVYSSAITNKQATISTTGFANGVYIVQIENERNTAAKKLIVNKN